MQELST